jgi:hypothetical protein
VSRCETCKHYRPALEKNSPVHTLHWLADSTEPPVYEELKRIAAEEYDRSQGETDRLTADRDAAIDRLNDFLRERGIEGHDFWNPPRLSDEDRHAFDREVKGRLTMRFAREPLTVTHCAVHAARGTYYIADVKNWADTCDDYASRERLPLCRKCCYYVESRTEQAKRAASSALVTAIGGSHQDAASILERRSGEIDGGIGPAKAHDIKLAYNTRGRLLRPLDFLPSCTAPCPLCDHSNPALDCPICQGDGVQIAQPEIFNRLLGCQAFSPAAARSAAEETRCHMPIRHAVDASSGDGAPPAGAQQAPTVVGRLGLSPFSEPPAPSGPASIVETFASQAVGFAFDRIREAYAGAAAQRRSRDAAETPEAQWSVLVPGRPPLTNEMLRRSLAVASAVHPDAMPDAKQRAYSALVGRVWKRNAEAGIRLQLSLIQMYDGDRSNDVWRSTAAKTFNEFVESAKSTGTR